ncbi:cupin domain-containing protein [Lacisediminihabitans profunda]|uniref:cupin domain-containing protein n=1 Tax=Lacisediminihabitans profunda TaxID=2594790 RepID=UPI001C9CB629
MCSPGSPHRSSSSRTNTEQPSHRAPPCRGDGPPAPRRPEPAGGEPQAFKIAIPATDREPAPRTHTGYEWICVLSGRLRLILGEHDVVLGAGEAAEFDTRNPHWFGSTGAGPASLG